MLDLRFFATVFGSVFLAELGDKTQLATFGLAASSPGGRLSVFLGSALALVSTTIVRRRRARLGSDAGKAA